MKQLLIVAALMLSTVFASAASLSLGRDFSLHLSPSLNDTYLVGSYDFVNKRPLAGYGKEFLHFNKGDISFAYMSARHMFDSTQKGKGQFGLALGGNIGAFGQKVADVSGAVGSVVPTPSWLSKAANFVSVEVGGGYWPEPLTDTKPWSWDVGGKIRIPLSDFFDSFEPARN